MVVSQLHSTTIYYPESDGRPMVETDTHYRVLTGLRFGLEFHFRDDPQVYVGANLMLYYQEGDPSKCVSPDVFVTFGVPKGDRRTFKVWEEGKSPDVVFELTSDSTRSEDLGLKCWLYSQLGVREYFLFDPLRQYLRPSLRGYRLIGDEYVRIGEEPAKSGELRLKSEVLNLELLAKGGQLRLLDPASGIWLPLPAELEAAWREAEARAAQEGKARKAAEAEVERLRTELQRLRGE